MTAVEEEFDTGGWGGQAEEAVPPGNKGIDALLTSRAAERAPPASQQQLAVNNVGLIVSEKIATEIPSAGPEAASVPPTTSVPAADTKGAAPSASPQDVVTTDAPPPSDAYHKAPHEKVKTISAFLNLSVGPVPSTTTATSAVGQGYVPSGRGGAEGTDPAAHRRSEVVQQELPKPPPEAVPHVVAQLESTAAAHAKELAEKNTKAKEERASGKRKSEGEVKKDPEAVPNKEVEPEPNAKKEKHEAVPEEHRGKKEKKEKKDKEKKHKDKKKKHDSKKETPPAPAPAPTPASAPAPAPTPTPAPAPSAPAPAPGVKRPAEETQPKKEKKHKHHKKDKEKKKHRKDKEKKHKKHGKKDKKHRGRKDDISEGEESDGSLDSDERREEENGVDLVSEESESSDSYEEDSVVGNYSGTDASEEAHGRDEYVDSSAKKLSAYEKRKEEEFKRKRKEEAKKAKKEEKKAKKEERSAKKKAKKEKEEAKEVAEAVQLGTASDPRVRKITAEDKKNQVTIPMFPCKSDLKPLDDKHISSELDQLLIAIGGYLMEYHHKGSPSDAKGPLYEDCMRLMEAAASGVCERSMVSQASVARTYFFGASMLPRMEKDAMLPLGMIARMCLDCLVKLEVLPAESERAIVNARSRLMVVTKPFPEQSCLKISVLTDSPDHNVSNRITELLGDDTLADMLKKIVFWLRPIDGIDTLVIEFAAKHKKTGLNELGLFTKSFATSRSDYIDIVPGEFVPWASKQLDEFKKRLMKAHSEATALVTTLWNNTPGAASGRG